MIPPVLTRAYSAPDPFLLPPVVASIYPQARRDARHVSGGVMGGLLTYADLHAFAWWYGGGWLTLNRGKKGLRRVHRGNEDVTQVRR